MRRKIYGIFVAGGSGTRMGGEVPKQFLTLDGRPILQRTIECFLEAEPDLKVLTVLPRAHFQTWKDLCAVHSFHCPQTLVAGGLTRFHSVQNALRKVPDGAIVAIHDGVRPLISPALVRRMLDRMEQDGCRALLPVVPVVDTPRHARPGPLEDRRGPDAPGLPLGRHQGRLHAGLRPLVHGRRLRGRPERNTAHPGGGRAVQSQNHDSRGPRPRRGHPYTAVIAWKLVLL